MTTSAPLEAASGPAWVPAAGDRRRHPAPAHLRFFHGPMDCGKSTLALQIDHNHARQGRSGMLLVRYDRSGRPSITTRVGLTRPAVENTDDTDIRLLVQARGPVAMGCPWAGNREKKSAFADTNTQ